jgi:phospholipid N-methyltransferase
MPTADWSESLRFFARFVRHPGTVGSVAPSSRQLAAAMVRPLAAAGSDGRITVAELGPGTGAFTAAIVEKLQPGDRLLAVELEQVFCQALRRRWPGIDAVCASAETLRSIATSRGIGSVDHIVSGLPFATLPVATTGRIVEAIGETLRPGGTFTTFHYAHSLHVPRARAFRGRVADVLGAEPTMELVAWNFPPAFAVSWTRRAASEGRSRDARSRQTTA